MSDVADEAPEQSEIEKTKIESSNTKENIQSNKSELTVVLDEDLLEMDYYNPLVRLARILLDIARNPNLNTEQKKDS
jgi:hypothetical protein